LVSVDFEWAPTVDNVELDEPPWVKVQKGDVQKVPVIVGFVRDESASSQDNVNMTEREFDAVLDAYGVSGIVRSQVKAVYTAEYTEWYWAAYHFTADYSVSCPTRRFVQAALAAKMPVFAYKFSRQPSFPVELMYGPTALKVPQHQWGAYHGAELPFVFGNAKVPAWGVELTEDEQHLASVIGDHWISLAKTGAVSHRWPPAALSRQWHLLDSQNVSLNEANMFPTCDVIDELGDLGPMVATAPAHFVI